MLKVGELVATIDLIRTGFDSGMQAVGSAFKNVGASLSKLGGQMQSVGSSLTKYVTAPILALKAAIIKVGVEFDTALRRIVALTDVTADEIGDVEDAILDMATAVGKSPQELAEAFYFLASAGFDTKEAMEVLEVAAKGSAAGLGDTQDLAKVAGAAVNAYGKENLTAAHAMDVLLRGVKDGTAESTEFAGALGDVLGSAAQMGVGIEDLTAGLAALTLKGINVNEAATSMNGIFVSLLKPTVGAEKAMKEMGFSAASLRKKLKEDGLLATLEFLKKKFEGNDTAAASVFGNVRALRGVLGLLGGDASQTAGVFEDLAGAGGDVNQAFKETEGPGREMDRAMADVQATLIDLSRTVMPLMVEGLHGLRDILEQVRTWWHSLSEEQQTQIVQIAGIVAVVGPLLVILGTLLTVLGPIVGLIGAIIALPFAPVLLAIAAAAALIVANWQTIEPIFNSVVAAVQLFIDQAVQFLQPIIENLTTVVFPQLAAVINDIVQAVLPPLQEAIALLGAAWQWIEQNILPPVIQIIRVLTDDVFPALADMVGQVVGFIMDHMDVFISIVKTAFDVFVRVLKAAAQLAGAIIYGVASVISAAINVIADVFEFIAPIIMNVAKVVLHALLVAADALLPVFKFVFEAIGNVVSTVAEIISNVISAAIVVFVGAMKAFGDASTAVLKVVRSVWDGITSAIKGAINLVIGIINGFIRAINSIQIHIPEVGVGPVHTPAFDWNGVNLGQIPYLAKGTPFFKGGWAVVGEQGPELARLPTGTQVFPNGKSRDMMGGDGGQGGTPITQHIYGMDPEEVERQTKRAIRRAALEWSLEGKAT